MWVRYFCVQIVFAGAGYRQPRNYCCLPEIGSLSDLPCSFGGESQNNLGRVGGIVFGHS
jgi:hypothetical protein